MWLLCTTIKCQDSSTPQASVYKETYQLQEVLMSDEKTLTLCCFTLKWEAILRENMGGSPRKSKYHLYLVPSL